MNSEILTTPLQGRSFHGLSSFLFVFFAQKVSVNFRNSNGIFASLTSVKQSYLTARRISPGASATQDKTKQKRAHMDKIFASGQNIAVIASYPNNLAKATSLCLVLRTSKLWTFLSISISLCHNAASFPISNIFISYISPSFLFPFQNYFFFSFFHFQDSHLPSYLFGSPIGLGG